MTTKGFTKVNNSILFDLELSPEAFGIYAKIQYFANIKDFIIKRNHIKSLSGYGETAFSRVWKELKDKGVLIEIKSIVKGRFDYTYTLKTDGDIKKTEKPKEKVVTPVKKVIEKAKVKIDSNGDAPLDGQVHIEDILQQEVYHKKDIEVVAEITGLKDEEVTELLKVAKNDIGKVIKGYEYTAAQENVRDSFSYTKWAIKNNKALKYTSPGVGKVRGIFNDYPQRTYDFDKLERALLYGEYYEMPV